MGTDSIAVRDTPGSSKIDCNQSGIDDPVSPISWIGLIRITRKMKTFLPEETLSVPDVTLFINWGSRKWLMNFTNWELLEVGGKGTAQPLC